MTSPAPSNRGILLAVEGIDGAGKTTQVALLAEALAVAEVEVATSKEPTNGKWGRKIRESAENGRLPARQELEAFIEDRHEHVAQTINPALEQGRVVILDRYFYSTIAYQGERRIADVDWLDRMMRKLAPVPDLVFVLDIHPAQGLARIREQRGESPNQFEKEENLGRIRNIFKHLCEIDPILAEIDGSMAREAVHAVMLGKLLAGPLKTKWCAKSYGCDDPAHCIPKITGHCEWARLYRDLTDHVDSRYRGLMDDPYPSQPTAAAG